MAQKHRPPRDHKSRKLAKRIKEKYGTCKTCVFTYKRKSRGSDEQVCHRSQFDKKNYLVEMMGGKCEICGYDKSIVALSFHHKDKKGKTFTISSHLGLPMEDLIAEVKKCSMICLNCHAELHNGKSKRNKDCKAVSPDDHASESGPQVIQDILDKDRQIVDEGKPAESIIV